jgi:glycosyltransferase involved in cell wall biosynthesis
VSFLEALGGETPLVSCQDPGGTVSRFGAYVGRWDGDGTASVAAFVGALESLFADPRRRRQLGERGREWVRETHSRPAFDRAFDALLARAGLRRPTVA